MGATPGGTGGTHVPPTFFGRGDAIGIVPPPLLQANYIFLTNKTTKYNRIEVLNAPEPPSQKGVMPPGPTIGPCVGPQVPRLDAYAVA